MSKIDRPFASNPTIFLALVVPAASDRCSHGIVMVVAVMGASVATNIIITVIIIMILDID